MQCSFESFPYAHSSTLWKTFWCTDPLDNRLDSRLVSLPCSILQSRLGSQPGNNRVLHLASPLDSPVDSLPVKLRVNPLPCLLSSPLDNPLANPLDFLLVSPLACPLLFLLVSRAANHLGSPLDSLLINPPPPAHEPTLCSAHWETHSISQRRAKWHTQRDANGATQRRTHHSIRPAFGAPHWSTLLIADWRAICRAISSQPSGEPCSEPTSAPTSTLQHHTETCYSTCSYPGMTVHPDHWKAEEYCAFYASVGCTQSGIEGYTCSPDCLSTCPDVFCDTFSTLLFCGVEVNQVDKAQIEGKCMASVGATMPTTTIMNMSIGIGFQNINQDAFLADAQALATAVLTLSNFISGVPLSRMRINAISALESSRRLRSGRRL